MSVLANNAQLIKAAMYSVFVLTPILFALLAYQRYGTKNKNYQPKKFYGFIFIILIGSAIFWYHERFYRFDLKVSYYKIHKNSTAISKNKIPKQFRIATFADIHLGLFKQKSWAQRVAKELENIHQKTPLDMILVPGDWTLSPNIDELTTLFSPFQRLNVPIYGVLGNHDVGQPRETFKQALFSALQKNNIHLIDDEHRIIEKAGHRIHLLGIQDRWQSGNNVEIVKTIFNNKNNENNEKAVNATTELHLAIAHNPDSVRDYRYQLTEEEYNHFPPFMTITGHTHCGQVRIPGLYKHVLPVQNGYYDKGFYEEKQSRDLIYQSLGNPSKYIMTKNRPSLFITCGVGEVGFPLRFNNPPMIDVLTFEL